jgi:hypothetical protein
MKAKPIMDNPEELFKQIDSLLAGHGTRIVSFDYLKENGGPVERRNVLLGANIFKAQEKRGTPVNGTGNWHKGATLGTRSFAIFRNGEWYIRGYSMPANEIRTFKVSGISNLQGI